MSFHHAIIFLFKWGNRIFTIWLKFTSFEHLVNTRVLWIKSQFGQSLTWRYFSSQCQLLTCKRPFKSTRTCKDKAEKEKQKISGETLVYVNLLHCIAHKCSHANFSPLLIRFRGKEASSFWIRIFFLNKSFHQVWQKVNVERGNLEGPLVSKCLKFWNFYGARRKSGDCLLSYSVSWEEHECLVQISLQYIQLLLSYISHKLWWRRDGTVELFFFFMIWVIKVWKSKELLLVLYVDN